MPMVTINADSAREARHVLDALGVLGDSCTVQRASESESAAWRETAMTPRGKMQRLTPKKIPAIVGSAGVSEQRSLPVV
jgi:hypothetical protein